MASGHWASGRYGNSTGPWVELWWDEREQDIVGNRTKVRLRFYFYWDHRIAYNFYNVSGNVHGTSFRYTGSASGGSGYRLLRTQEVWVPHNADGTKSQSFSATVYTLGLNWGGNNIGTMTVSGTAKLTTIPRKHTVSGASMSANLKPNTANTLNVTGTAHYTGFYYWTGIYDGATKIWDYGGYYTGTPFGKYPIPASAVNAMLNRMGSVTSKSFRARVWTYSGNGTGKIGEDCANFTVYADGSIVPSISSRSVSEYVSGLNAQFGAYVQNKSRLSLAMTASAGYGASIRSYRIVANGTTYTTRTATTEELKNSGSQTITFEVTDSRGRKTSAPITINVVAYSPPQIANLMVDRSNDQGEVDEDGTHALVKYNVAVSPVGNKNKKSFILRYRKNGTDPWQSITLPNTDYNYNTSRVIGPLDVDYAFDVQIVVKDYFDEIVLTDIVQSTFTLINFSSNKRGLSFGKTYNEALGGILQLTGDVFVNSDLMDFVIDYQWNSGQSEGKWLKFNGGLMIQWGHSIKTINYNTAWGSLYYGQFGTIVYPHAFKYTPYFLPYAGDSSTFFAGKNSAGASATQSVRVDVYRPVAGSYPAELSWIAIGQWK